MTLLGQGRSPAEVPLAELCVIMQRTKGSFYTHFRGGLGELQQEVIGRWLGSKLAGLAAARAVHNPPDRLRILRDGAAAQAVADDAMRRWQAGHPAAGTTGRQREQVTAELAAALTAADGAAREALAEAFTDMGFTRPEAGVLAVFVARALAAGDAADPQAAVNPDAFEVLLAVLRRAGDAARVVEVTAAGPGEIALYLVARDLPADQARQIGEDARHFLAGRSAAGPGPAPVPASESRHPD
jgi:hypothetical protein